MSPEVLSLLADLLAAAHLAFVSFVFVGEIVILVGIVARWRWIRNFWFRICHLTAIGAVALEAALALPCPLTLWEAELRTAAGQTVSEISFMGRVIQWFLYYDEIPASTFRLFYLGFAGLVVLTFLIAPPRWRGAEPAGEGQTA